MIYVHEIGIYKKHNYKLISKEFCFVWNENELNYLRIKFAAEYHCKISDVTFTFTDKEISKDFK